MPALLVEFDEQEKRDALGKGLAEFNKKTLVFCIIGIYAIKIGHKRSFSRNKNLKKIIDLKKENSSNRRCDLCVAHHFLVDLVAFACLGF